MPMKQILTNASIAYFLLTACGGPVPQTTSSRPETPKADQDEIRSLPDFSSNRIPDPVFGGSIYFLEAGPKTAPPLVLVHGLGANGIVDWYPVLKGLSTHYRVLALDLPGFGRSSRSELPYKPVNYVKAIRELTHSRIGRPFFLLGHSMGGAISLLYAGTYSGDIKRLVLVDVAGILHQHVLTEHGASVIADSTPLPIRGPVSQLTHVLSQTLKDANINADHLISEDIRTALLGNHPATVAALSLVEFNFGPATGAITAPTLLLWGKYDNVAPLRIAKVLRSRIAGAQLTVFEHSAHVPMTTEPDTFVDAVHEYLQSVDPVPSAPSVDAINQGRGWCKDQANVHFKGKYDTVSIDNCSGVILSRVTTTAVFIDASTVTIDDTVINGIDTGLTVNDSVVSMTGGRISGDRAVHANDVVFDLAGVQIVGNIRAISETSSAQILCSICKVESPLINRYVHDLVTISPAHPLENRP